MSLSLTAENVGHYNMSLSLTAEYVGHYNMSLSLTAENVGLERDYNMSLSLTAENSLQVGQLTQRTCYSAPTSLSVNGRERWAL